MTYFAYRVVGKTEYNGFDVPQTPQSFADDTEQRLTDPDFLEGDKRFALVVWALPEGVNHVDDVPQDSVAHGNYIQCAGSTHAMTVEIRVTAEDGSYEQCTVARKPVTDPMRGQPSHGLVTVCPFRCTPKRFSRASRRRLSSALTLRTA